MTTSDDEQKKSVEVFFPVERRNARPKGHLRMGISFKVRNPSDQQGQGKAKPSTMSDIKPETGRRSC